MWVEERPGFYRIEVPLPGNPLKTLNAYLIRGKERNLLVDNGFNRDECHAPLGQSLSEIGVEPKSLDLFITHLHADHNGLTSRLATPDSRIFCGRVDGEIINSEIQDRAEWSNLLRTLGQHGFPDQELAEVEATHPGRIYANPEPVAFDFIEEGAALEYGPYRLRAISVPGHTPGQFVLMEDQQSFLISADHILGTITPNITFWSGVEDSLGNYLQSLEKIKKIGPQVSYPGHRAIVPDTLKRIGELEAHHERRLADAERIIKEKGRANAWQVAAEMKWDLRGSWADYRAAQKNFATGEAIAHLDHLVALGKLAKESDSGQIYYTRK